MASGLYAKDFIHHPKKIATSSPSYTDVRTKPTSSIIEPLFLHGFLPLPLQHHIQ